MSEGLICRAPVVDEYVVGGESAVMVGNQVVVLSELATALLALVPDKGISVPDLAQALVARYGPPAEGISPEDQVESMVFDLESAGLLTR